MRSSRLLILIFFFPVIAAQAEDLCQVYRNFAPPPKWYADLCNRDGTSKATLGGAYSTLGDAFNLNPAAIPTVKIPGGAEYIHSFSGSGSKDHFAFIKGFNHVGAALTTNSEENFYGNSVFQSPHTSTTSTLTPNGIISSTSASNGINSLNKSIFPTLNLGSAVDLASFIQKKEKMITEIIPTLGIMGKYNKNTGGFSPAFGASWKIWQVSLGYSYATDPANGISPSAGYTTLTAGFKARFFQLEVMRISQSQTTYYGLGGSIEPAMIYSLSTHLGSFSFVGAMRKYNDILSAVHTEYHFAVEYLLAPRVMIQFLHNYVVDQESAGIQVLF